MKLNTVDWTDTTGRHEAIDYTAQAVHSWRISRLTHLGIPAPLAVIYADRLDWHQIARLVQRGCPPLLALRIVR